MQEKDRVCRLEGSPRDPRSYLQPVIAAGKIWAAVSIQLWLGFTALSPESTLPLPGEMRLHLIAGWSRHLLSPRRGNSEARAQHSQVVQEYKSPRIRQRACSKGGSTASENREEQTSPHRASGAVRTSTVGICSVRPDVIFCCCCANA